MKKSFRILKKLLIYTLNLPLYYLMYLIKPKKNIWVFGAWFGENYLDNSRAFFKYIQKKQPNINPVWITADKAICDNKTFIYRNSFKGYYYALIGDVYCVTHTISADLYLFLNKYNRIFVQFWHGIPIKKIMADDKIQNKQIIPNFMQPLKFLIFPFTKTEYSLVIASSICDQKNMSTAFSTPIQQVAITGHPRNDIFENSHSEYLQFKILYAPTLRGIFSDRDEVNLFDDFGFDNKKILLFLEKNNIYLDIKMHPLNTVDPQFKNLIKSDYVNFLESQLDSQIEINEVLQDYSIIISDYSGLYVDYLLTDRPIIFAPFDYEKYLTKDRELYYDYDEVTPGPKCKNWDEVLVWIEKFKKNPDLFKKEREIVKNKFHKYQDGKNCERVYKEIMKITADR